MEVELRAFSVVTALSGLLITISTWAQSLGVGAGGGVAIPLTKYMNYVPVEGLNPSSANVENSVGFSFHAEILATKWFELRYSMTGLGYRTIESVNEKGEKQSFSTSNMPWLMFHSVTLGTRINLIDRRAHLYIPIAVGPTFVQFANNESFSGQYGVSAQSGLEFDYQVLKGIRIGIGVRYQFYLTNKPNEVVQDTVVESYKREYAPFIKFCSKHPTDPRCKTNYIPKSDNITAKDVVALLHSITVNGNISFGF